MKGIGIPAVLLLSACVLLGGCSKKHIYSEEEMTQIHDIASAVEERQIAYYNVIEGSVTDKLERILAGDSSITSYISMNSLDASKPALALTFNAGPDTEVTEKILDILEENHAHATFFVDPDKLTDETAAVVKRMSRVGCEVGLYITDPGELADYTAADLNKTLRERIAKIEQYSGRTCTLVRPYGGYMQDMIVDALKLPVILWSVDTEDAVYEDAATTRTLAQTYASDGGIILMHDLYESTANAVRNLLPDLAMEGYQLTTISELVHVKDATLKAGGEYYTIESQETDTGTDDEAGSGEDGQDDEW